MKYKDPFYNLNLKNRPDKHLTPVILIGNLQVEHGIRDPYLDQEEKDFIKTYQDFKLNKVFLFAPHNMRLKFDNPAIPGTHDTLEAFPCLLNDPKLNQSVDFKDKKIKVNNIKIDLHNMKFKDDKTITDMFGDMDLEGADVRLLWVNPNINHVINVHELHFGYESEELQNTEITQMFIGSIEEIQQKKDMITLDVQDYSKKLFKQKIPIKKMPDNNFIQDRYKLKPIPMVYGKVDKAPLIMFDDTDYDNAFYLLADDTYDNDSFDVTVNPEELFLGNDNDYFYVPQKSKARFELENTTLNFNDADQVETNNGSQVGKYFKLKGSYTDNGDPENPIASNFIHTKLIRKPSKTLLEDGLVPLSEFSYMNGLGPSDGNNIGSPEFISDNKLNTKAAFPETILDNQPSGYIEGAIIYAPNNGEHNFLFTQACENANFEQYHPNFLNDSTNGNLQQDSFYAEGGIRDAQTYGTYGIISGDCMTHLADLLIRNIDYGIFEQWDTITEGRGPSLYYALSDPKYVNWFTLNRKTLEDYGYDLENSPSSTFLNDWSQHMGEANTIYTTIKPGNQNDNTIDLSEAGIPKIVKDDWENWTNSAVPASFAETYFSAYSDEVPEEELGNSHASFFRNVAGISKEGQTTQSKHPNTDYFGLGIRYYMNFMHTMSMHASGIVLGFQLSVPYTDPSTGNVQYTKMYIPFNMDLTRDHNNNSFGTSDLKFWKAPGQLTEDMEAEGIDLTTLGRTVWHWASSVSGFIGDFEHDFNETIFDNDQDFNYNPAIFWNTYLMSGRSAMLESPTSKYYNGQPFTQTENNIAEGFIYHGSLSQGWNPSMSIVYFVNPDNFNPYVNFGPSSTQRFETTDPMSRYEGNYNHMGIEDISNICTNLQNGTPLSEQLRTLVITSEAYFGDFGRLSGVHLYDPGSLDLEVPTQEFVEVAQYSESNQEGTNITYYDAVRMRSLFDSVSDKDVVACSTTFMLKMKSLVQWQYIEPGINAQIGDFVLQLGTGSSTFFVLMEKEPTTNEVNYVDVYNVIFNTYNASQNTSDYNPLGPNCNFGTGYELKNETLNWNEVNKFNSLQLTWYAGSFDTRFNLAGYIYDLGIQQEILIKDIQNKEYYGNVQGRKDANYESYYNTTLDNAIDVCTHIVTKELGYGNDIIDQPSLTLARNHANLYGIGTWKFGFSLNKEVEARSYLEELGKSGNFVTKIGSTGLISYLHYPDHVDSTILQDNVNSMPHTEIDPKKIIKYKFSRSKKSSLVTRINVKYGYDHLNNKTAKETGYLEIDKVLEDKYRYTYNFDKYGIEKQNAEGKMHPDSTLEMTVDHISDIGSARRLRKYMLLQHCNLKLKLDVSLDIEYSYIELGDIITFSSLIDNIRPYKEDYTRFDLVNGQTLYPAFIVKSVRFNTKRVDLKLERLVRLDYGSAIDPTMEGDFNFKNMPEFTDSGYSYTSEGIFRSRHNPFTTDESALPGAGITPGQDPLVTEDMIGSGDFNYDFIVNVQDVVATIVAIIEGDFTADELLRADMNQDGILNILDVVQMVQEILD